jgi:transcriptional regulator NrdR family protein
MEVLRMKCPKCNGSVKVTDVVQDMELDHNDIYRQRTCDDCGHIFYTVEGEIDVNKVFEKLWVRLHRRKSKVKT